MKTLKFSAKMPLSHWFLARFRYGEFLVKVRKFVLFSDAGIIQKNCEFIANSLRNWVSVYMKYEILMLFETSECIKNHIKVWIEAPSSIEKAE